MGDKSLTIRKLAWCSGGFALGALLAIYTDSWYLPAAVSLCLVVAAFFALKSLWRQRLFLFAIALALGLCYSVTYAQIVISPAKGLDGSTAELTVVAKDRARVNGGVSSLPVRVINEDGRDFGAMIYDFDELLPEVTAGDVLVAEFRLKRADIMRGEEYFSAYGKGNLLFIYPVGEVHNTGERELRYAPRRITLWVEDSVSRLFPKDVAPLMIALLTGEKSELYKDEELQRAMAHSGISHIVAVSGMHVSFIIGAIYLFFGRGRAAMLGIPLVILFMLMTGLTPSVVRAGFMYIALLLAPKLKRENDVITTLFAVLLLILLQNPMAIMNLGLQLSFASMSGIILLSAKISKPLDGVINKRVKVSAPRNFLHSMNGIAAMSVASTVATAPIIAYNFGYISLFSPLTNVLTNPAVTIAFCLGYLACAAGYVFLPAGILLAQIITPLIRYLFAVVKAIAGMSGSVLRTHNVVNIEWLLLVALIFAIAYYDKEREGFRPIIPIGLSIITLCAASLVTNVAARYAPGEISVLSVGQGQSIVMIANDATVVIDCGSMGSYDNAGDITSDYLLSRGRKRVDALILTHLHADHANGVVTLFNSVDVTRLVLPENADDADGLLTAILSSAKAHGTEIHYISEDTGLACGEIDLTIFAPLSESSENERGLIINGGVGELDALITGDVGILTERELIYQKELRDTEILMVGHHGSSGSTGIELLAALRPDVALVSVGYNSYGHPTEAVLERIERFGIELFRTDFDGNVTIYED